MCDFALVFDGDDLTSGFTSRPTITGEEISQPHVVVGSVEMVRR